jgi:hypothetical protein
MLTLPQYEDLWTSPAPNGFGKTIPCPDYHQYLQRSIYMQDYLDLFAKTRTFHRVRINDSWYIKITGNPILSSLQIPLSDPYCIRIENTDYLWVAYDYPWNDVELNGDRIIKYIMIGEAPPPVEKETYFYNLNDDENTPWLNAPFSAFTHLLQVEELTKKKKLYYLANKGYILLDIFPFATVYESNFRDELNQGGTSENFFLNQINRKLRNYQAFNLLDDSPILAFSGPGIIHHFLADLVSIGRLQIMPNNVTCRSYQNQFGSYSPATNLMPNKMISWPEGYTLNGIYPYTILRQIPFYRCCCFIVGGNYAPHEILIRNAFF